MSAVITPNAKQQIEESYRNMMVAYDRYFHCADNQREYFKTVYDTALNNYRDTCTVVVKRLMQTNPKVLEDLTVLWLS